MCPRTPQFGEFDYYPAYPSAGCVTYIGFEISKEILEGLMSSFKHHKVCRNLFIIKGGIEVNKCFSGNFGHLKIIILAIFLNVIDGHQ